MIKYEIYKSLMFCNEGDKYYFNELFFGLTKNI